jgi:hypothetical protein
MAINPLSMLLNATQYGFKIKGRQDTIYTISRLLYMDDLKIYASNETQLKHMIKVTHKFSEDIGMKFSLDKCRTLHINRGKITNIDDTLFPGIEAMTVEERYKYLGIKQATTMDHGKVKEEITKQFQKRIDAILKTELNGKNTTKAINTFAIPVLTYTFGIFKWSETDLNNLQCALRTTLTKHRAHHSTANAERMTLPRKDGGRGITDIKNLHNRQIMALRKYFYQSYKTTLLRAIISADKEYTPLNLANENMTLHIKTTTEISQEWAKPIHGKHY